MALAYKVERTTLEHHLGTKYWEMMVVEAVDNVSGISLGTLGITQWGKVGDGVISPDYRKTCATKFEQTLLADYMVGNKVPADELDEHEVNSYMISQRQLSYSLRHKLREKSEKKDYTRCIQKLEESTLSWASVLQILGSDRAREAAGSFAGNINAMLEEMNEGRVTEEPAETTKENLEQYGDAWGDFA